MSHRSQQVLTTVAILGGIISLLTIGDRLIGWMRSSLVMRVEYAPFVQPLRMVRHGTPESIVQTFRRAEGGAGVPETGRVRQDVLTSFAFEMRDSLVPMIDFVRLETLWRIQVENTAGERLSAVTVTIPGGKLASYQRRGEQRVEQTMAEVLAVGDLRPGETLDILVWGRSTYASEDAAVQVVHDRGRGTVWLRRPVGAFGQLTDSIASAPILLLAFLFAAFCACVMQTWVILERVLSRRVGEGLAIEVKGKSEE